MGGYKVLIQRQSLRTLTVTSKLQKLHSANFARLHKNTAQLSQENFPHILPVLIFIISL